MKQLYHVAIFSIKDIESLTGIKSHTIRIWEQRYGLIQAKRSETNIRFYDDQDLKRFLNINLLYQSGRKISHIAKMSESELLAQVQSVGSETADTHLRIQALLRAMLDFNEASFDLIISKAGTELGVRACMEELILPFLRHIGLLWQIGTIDPSCEHFISNRVRAWLTCQTEKLDYCPSPKAPRFILFLPEDENHELGLLLANFMIREKGFASLYLGTHLPHRDLKSAINTFNAQYLFCSASTENAQTLRAGLIQEMCTMYPQVFHLFTGSGFIHSQCDLPKHAQYIRSVSEFQHFLDRLSLQSKSA